MTQQALFDPLAELYGRYAEINDEVYRPWLTRAVEAAGPGDRAADLGCGTGRFTGLLAGSYGSVLAVDVSARELELAAERHPRPEVTYEQRSLLDVTPATDGRFDLVLSVNTIFHLRDHDRVLPHVRDLVAPGGWAVLVDIVSPDGARARTPSCTAGTGWARRSGRCAAGSRSGTRGWSCGSGSTGPGCSTRRPTGR